MLDLSRLESLTLHERPLGQRCLAGGFLAPNYWLYPGVEIEVEGWEHLPEEPVIFAMNHTDRFNYWPFQFQLWWERGRYTASWVKGKYYQRELLGDFLEWTNNIPTVSRGYVIAQDFLRVADRSPDASEYSALRDLIDARMIGERAPALEARARRVVPEPIFEESRHMLGLDYNARRESYADVVCRLFRRMMRRFVELNGEALEMGLDLLVFPEGTRAVQLQRGRIGLAQIALYYDVTIVPVGCNGSDRIYPGDLPIAREGQVTYRIGSPIGPEERAPYAIDEPFEPFSPEAERTYRERFQGLVDLVMERINERLDPRHQFAGDLSERDRSADRFV